MNNLENEKKYTKEQIINMLNSENGKSNKVKVTDFKIFNMFIVLRKIEYVELKTKVMK